MDSETRKVFEQVLAFWPDEIDVSEKKLHDNGGASIPELARIHWEIEDKVLRVDSAERKLECMDWAIYTVLHIEARTNDCLKVRDIQITSVLERYKENMSSI